MRLFGKPSADEIFQVALNMSLEWGQDWLSPINERIRKKYSFLSEEEAETLNKKCKEIQNYCWDDLCLKEVDGKISGEDVEQEMKKKYPEVNSKNLSRLISQGYYYARK